MAKAPRLDKEIVMKKIGRILDHYDIKLDRENISEDIFEVLDETYYLGFCEGIDSVHID